MRNTYLEASYTLKRRRSSPRLRWPFLIYLKGSYDHPRSTRILNMSPYTSSCRLDIKKNKSRGTFFFFFSQPPSQGRPMSSGVTGTNIKMKRHPGDPSIFQTSLERRVEAQKCGSMFCFVLLCFIAVSTALARIYSTLASTVTTFALMWTSRCSLWKINDVVRFPARPRDEREILPKGLWIRYLPTCVTLGASAASFGECRTI